jgi:hypothetical protein
MNAMNAIAKRTYAVGWLLLILAVIERLLITKESVLLFANAHNILPHNFLQLSVVFFVITIASRACCAPEKA